jgi:hypothetical protein
MKHNGHSRTVVGYEETAKGDLNLLMFDPGKCVGGWQRQSQDEKANCCRIVPTTLREAGLRHTSIQRNVPRPGAATTSAAQISSTRKASHESIPFSVPYTNGASELTTLCDTPRAASPTPRTLPAGHAVATGNGSGGPQRLGGGSGSADLRDDEEADEQGWVTKRIHRLKSSSRLSAGSGERLTARYSSDAEGSSTGGSKKPKLGDGVASKGMAYFRVNLSTLG